MWQFIKDHWSTTAAVAVVALVQPWLRWAWNKWAKTGSVDVHLTGNLDIGFSGLGATLGASGTLRAVGRDIFINNITVEVVRTSDGARHTLDWGAFRGRAVAPALQAAPPEMPAAFMLLMVAPKPFNIIFIDEGTQVAVKGLTQPVTSSWQQSLQAANIPANPPEGTAQHYRQTFQPTAIHVNAFADLDPLIYWRPGDYNVHMHIHSTRPARTFDYDFQFTLTPADVVMLRLNRLGILAAACNQPAQYNFAYAAHRALV